MKQIVVVIPLKSGNWKTVVMSDDRYRRWYAAYRRWWNSKGHRLSISPEMWPIE